MAPNTSKCNHLTSLHFKGLILETVCLCRIFAGSSQCVCSVGIGRSASSRGNDTRERWAHKTVDKRTWPGARHTEQAWSDGRQKY